SRADRGERPLRERGVAALVAAEPRRGRGVRRRRGWPVGRAAARARPPRARRRRRRGGPHRRGAHGEHGRAPPRPRARAGPLGRPRPGRAPCPRAARARPVGRAGADRARARVVPASRARAVPLRAPHGRPRRARPLAADRSPRLVAWARAAARVAGARTGYTRAEHVARSEHDLADVARRTFVATVVVLGVVVLALVLWKARLIVTLLFLAIVLASAMRSSVDALHRRGVPKAAGIGLHYAAVAGLLALLLWVAVPRAIDQVEQAVGAVPTSRSDVAREARQSAGLEHELLVGLERRLRNLPSARELVRPAIDVTRKALEILVGVFFVLASAAYWIYERDRAERLLLRLVPKRKRHVVSETWRLVDLKLGAFVRGQLLLVVLVGTVLSLAFWGVGEPYWILLGPFAGVVELVPVVGPLAAGVVAVGAGLTASWHVALAAGLVVLAVRLLE